MGDRLGIPGAVDILFFSFYTEANFLTINASFINSNFRFTYVYGHTTLKAPVLVRSPKLSNVGPGQYLDGWPPGNTGCSRHSFLFILYWSQRVLTINASFINSNFRFTYVYGHTTLKAPVLVRSPKLSNVGPGQYLDGWPPGNTGCSRHSFWFSRNFISEANVLTINAIPFFNSNFKRFTYVYGHTTLKAPVLVRSPNVKHTWSWPGQYLDGWPPGMYRVQ